MKGQSTFQINAERQNSDLAQGCEVIILGWLGANGIVHFDPDHFDDDWHDLRNADLGHGRRTPLAVKTETGKVEWPTGGIASLYVLMHPWSGVARVATDQKSALIDLFSAATSVARLDGETLELTALTPIEIDELAFALTRQLATYSGARSRRSEQVGQSASERDEQDIVRVAQQVGQGTWTLVGIGSVRIISAREEGRKIDLAARLNRPAPRLLSGGDVTLAPDPRGGWQLRGEAHVRLKGDAELILEGEPNAGNCLIDFGEGMHHVSLHREGSARIVVTAPGLSKKSKPRHFLTFDEDRQTYSELLATIDPDKPVALHVPRWKGVASSTLNLFEQRLPIPLHSNTPPETVNEGDIERYAKMLLASGARHFVISGGDLFFIKLARKVRESAPAVRFDLYWHSNWVALGASHDWWIFRQWLLAYNEGVISRIAVAKEGLDEFLVGSGIESVFIRNVITLDPEEIRPSRHDSSVGIWLSRSDDYRKLPNAALVALAQLQRYPLKASGLNYVARRLIDILDLPITRIWPDPIPRMQLYSEMASTAATLYVTLSECSPMLPLESFALGVPCIVGPCSHLFRDEPWLCSRLVVEDPLNPALIARKLDQVIEERDEIITRYREYARVELAHAKRGVERLTA